jgi:hypothetical protein
MSYDPDHDVKLLVECLKKIGVSQSDGSKTTTFIEVFRDEVLEQQLESLVGTLKAARTKGFIVSGVVEGGAKELFMFSFPPYRNGRVKCSFKGHTIKWRSNSRPSIARMSARIKLYWFLVFASLLARIHERGTQFIGVLLVLGARMFAYLIPADTTSKQAELQDDTQ